MWWFGIFAIFLSQEITSAQSNLLPIVVKVSQVLWDNDIKPALTGLKTVTYTIEHSPACELYLKPELQFEESQTYYDTCLDSFNVKVVKVIKDICPPSSTLDYMLVPQERQKRAIVTGLICIGVSCLIGYTVDTISKRRLAQSMSQVKSLFLPGATTRDAQVTAFARNVSREFRKIEGKVNAMQTSITMTPHMVQLATDINGRFILFADHLKNANATGRETAFVTNFLRAFGIHNACPDGSSCVMNSIKFLNCKSLISSNELDFTFKVQTLSKKFIVKKANAFHTMVKHSNGTFCTRTYTGVPYAFESIQHSCAVPITKLHYEGNQLIAPVSCQNSVESVQLLEMFKDDNCTETQPNYVDFLQVKSIDGYHNIYCYGTYITIHDKDYLCPPYPFRLKEKASFILNGRPWNVGEDAFSHKYEPNEHLMNKKFDIKKSEKFELHGPDEEVLLDMGKPHKAAIEKWDTGEDTTGWDSTWSVIVSKWTGLWELGWIMRCIMILCVFFVFYVLSRIILFCVRRCKCCFSSCTKKSTAETVLEMSTKLFAQKLHPATNSTVDNDHVNPPTTSSSRRPRNNDGHQHLAKSESFRRQGEFANHSTALHNTGNCGWKLVLKSSLITTFFICALMAYDSLFNKTGSYTWGITSGILGLLIGVCYYTFEAARKFAWIYLVNLGSSTGIRYVFLSLCLTQMLLWLSPLLILGRDETKSHASTRNSSHLDTEIMDTSFGGAHVYCLIPMVVHIFVTLYKQKTHGTSLTLASMLRTPAKPSDDSIKKDIPKFWNYTLVIASVVITVACLVIWFASSPEKLEAKGVSVGVSSIIWYVVITTGLFVVSMHQKNTEAYRDKIFEKSIYAKAGVKSPISAPLTGTESIILESIRRSNLPGSQITNANIASMNPHIIQGMAAIQNRNDVLAGRYNLNSHMQTQLTNATNLEHPSRILPIGNFGNQANLIGQQLGRIQTNRLSNQGFASVGGSSSIPAHNVGFPMNTNITQNLPVNNNSQAFHGGVNGNVMHLPQARLPTSMNMAQNSVLPPNPVQTQGGQSLLFASPPRNMAMGPPM